MSKDNDLILPGFTDRRYPAGVHMCLIYNNEQQRRDIISKFLQAGLQAGEKVNYIADLTEPAGVYKWLSERGVEIPTGEKKGQLNISEAKDFYYPDDVFFTKDIIERIGNFHQQAVSEGYAAFRSTGEMSWAKKKISGSEQLMEYEDLLNEVLDKYKITAICQYDIRLFDTRTIMEVLRTHPIVIMYGTVMPSPYYNS